MTVSFQNIPPNWRVPLFYAEVDGSMAGLPFNKLPALIVGTMTTLNTNTKFNGAGTPDIPVPIGRQQDADHLYGQGSELANMFKAFFRNNLSQEVWGLGVVESLNSVQASGTITITTPPSQAGTYHLMVGGTDIPINILAGTMTVNQIASAIAAAINALPGLPCTAVAAAAIVTITAKWGGVNGNEITMQDNYYGPLGGQIMPVGMVVTYSGPTLTGGVGVPDFTNAITNLGDNQYEYVALPYTDSDTLLMWEGEFGFSDGGRWGWQRMLYGLLYSAMRGTYSDLVLWGETRNSAVTTVMGFESSAPSPSYEWSAAYCAKAAVALTIDPARPLQTLHMEGIVPAKKHDRFILGESNSLAMNGIATNRTFDNSDVPQISRETLTYQVNLYGQPDDAFELVTTMATLSALIRNFRYVITTKYPRHKLADDGTRFAPGQAIVTPSIIKAEIVAQYSIDEFNGLVENIAAFKANLIVERDGNDPNRVNVLYPPDLINQLRMFAVLAQFRLQYDRGLDFGTLQ
jgi:phage tail sheath gpL-like